ncbi:MAG: hypothetical protein AAF483_10360, partial [Planctomycetota bacterium]
MKLRRALAIDPLEARRLLSITPEDFIVHHFNDDVPTEETMTQVGGKLLISASTPAFGKELQLVDPLTFDVRTIDVNPGIQSSDPKNIQVIGDFVFFSAISPSIGEELHWFDASEQIPTVHKFDVEPGLNNSYPRDFLLHNSKLAFRTGFTGTELRILDLSDRSLWTGDVAVYGSNIAISNDILFVTAFDPEYAYEPHWIDLASANPSMNLLSVSPGNNGNPGLPNEYVAIGDKVFFDSYGELRSVDTTEPSFTIQTIDVDPDSAADPSHLTQVGSKLFFSADKSNEGREMRWIDTADQNPIVDSINLSGDYSTAPTRLFEAGNRLYFAGNFKTEANELYFETLMFLDPNLANPEVNIVDPFMYSMGRYDMLAFGNRLFFDAAVYSPGNLDREIRWIRTDIDATSFSTVDTWPGANPTEAGKLGGFEVVSDRFFYTSDGPDGWRLRWFDASHEAPTPQTLDLFLGTDDAIFSRYLSQQVGSKLFFDGETTTEGNELRWFDIAAPENGVQTVDI